MSNIQRKMSMAEWLREALTSTEEGHCVAVSLVHHAGGQPAELKTVRIGSKPVDTSEMAKSFDRHATTHASGLPGVQQYELLVFYAQEDKESSEPGGHFPFRKTGELEMTGIATEGPTNSGITQQLMRHNEVLARNNAQMSMDMLEMSMRMNDMLSNQVQKLQRESLDAIELAKVVILKQADEETRRMIARQQAEDSSRTKQMVLKYGPALVNQLVGREVFPQSTVDSAIVEMITDELSEDQIRMFMAMVPVERQGIVAGRFEEILRRKREAQEANLALRTDDE